ncbi:flavin reductase family protein [Streptomyces iconiensis]|uniref:Flavin reductase family protein n=1 Tax=Streptomyces iconiensis TaxID=1384038 RepID=A0ABT7A436_9ACTN|nr:flavin reductase family protein [Streptomyces iconiensis]MDJ1135807.1 flavin reductase family protein [Streptomyces iconiensis]
MSASTAVGHPPGRTAHRDRDRERTVLRSLASGVAVLTAAHGEQVHGTTVSTLTAVSRSPLMVGACLRPGSVLADLARAGGRFAVNVLSADQSELARRFADPTRTTGAGQFDGCDWFCGPAPAVGGAPLFAGAIAHLSCRLSSWVPVGDHEVLLGLVTGASGNGGAPLLSYEGELHVPVLRAPQEEEEPAR